VIKGGMFKRTAREDLKAQVRKGDLRLILGTDAASEGLNLQRLGTLINLDLPWNPSRLEQRKGRIQRIGQVRDSVDIYNMRYAGSVEVGISRDNKLSFGGKGTGEHLIVVGVVQDHRRNCRGHDDACQFGVA
jgi:superfamily II DNA/RNA helicase